jgi:hypothetical protein
LKATKKDGHNTTGMLTARLEAWKLVPALFQLMMVVGHDGTIIPTCKLSKLFPGVKEPVLEDITEVVMSASASVLEFVWVLSANSMLVKDADVMYYLTSNMQYHQLRLNMLVKIITTFDSEQKFTLPDWRHVLDGDKKHAAIHVVDAKLEWGAHLRTWDTELPESYWKDCLKIPHTMSSKKDAEKRKQMVMYMKDRLCVDELKHSIVEASELLKVANGSLITIKVRNRRRTTFSLKSVYLQDELTWNPSTRCWVRLDHRTHYESRFLHPLTDMSVVSSYVESIRPRLSFFHIHCINTISLIQCFIQARKCYRFCSVFTAACRVYFRYSFTFGGSIL